MALEPGPDPDRVLLVGGSPAAGLGVRSQGEALTGRLALELAGRTGRGALVESAGRPSVHLADVAQLLPGQRLHRFDAVVLMAGMVEAIDGCSTARWKADLRELLDRVEAGVAKDAALVVTTLPSPSRMGPGSGWAAHAADHRARTLNTATRTVTAARRTTSELRLTTPDVRVMVPTAECYRVWAGQLADHLTPLLALTDSHSVRREARSVPDPEDERLAALQRTHLNRARPDHRFDDLAQRAHELLGGEVAAVGFIDADTHWFTSSVGAATEALPRAMSLCDHTLRTSSGLVVGDLSADIRFTENPLAQGAPLLRFYAGYPIESPDGYRIGSICVLSSTPRDPATVDLAALQALAFEARTRL